MLSQYTKKVKQFIEVNRQDIWVVIIIILTSIASFGLGRLSSIWPAKTPIRIEGTAAIRTANFGDTTEAKNNGHLPYQEASQKNDKTSARSGKYVASKSGTAYHYPWCIGAARIKEENKIWFNSKEEAEKTGYKPAGNCPGL